MFPLGIIMLKTLLRMDVKVQLRRQKELGISAEAFAGMISCTNRSHGFRATLEEQVM